MDLNEALATAPLFAAYTPDDEAALHDVFARSPMRVAGMELCYDRRPEFNAYLRYLSDHFVTIIGKRDGDVRTFGSFSWGPRLVNGAPTSAVYVGDFRALLDRKTTVAWRKLYPLVIDAFAASPALGPSPWALTAILKDNAAAYRALVAPRPGKKFFYTSVGELTMVNCLLRLPWRARPTLRAKLVRGAVVGEAALREFLATAAARQFLGYRFDRAPGNEWDRRARAWPGFALENFLVLVDDAGKILACTLPWFPVAKKIRLLKTTRVAALTYRALNLVGLRVPRVGQTLNTLYLSHLTFAADLAPSARADCIALFLDELHGRARDYHMVSYCDPASLRAENSLRGYYTQTTGVELFVVKTTPEPAVIPPHDGIGFEMSIA